MLKPCQTHKEEESAELSLNRSAPLLEDEQHNIPPFIRTKNPKTTRQSSQSIDNNTEMKSYKCIVCAKELNNAILTTLHTGITPGELPVKCTSCANKSSDTSKLIIHARIHTELDQFKYTICEQSFPSCTNLIAHTGCHIEKSHTNVQLAKRAFSNGVV